MSHWREPTSIIREASEIRKGRAEKKTLKQKLLSKNNGKASNGRIHLRQEGDVTWAITINPKRLMDYRVMEQNIEPRLRKLVRSLIRKRYYTLSSCQSHGPDFNCYVTCAIYSTDIVEKLERSFKNLGWWFSDIKVLRPEEYINSSFDEKTETMVHLKPDHEQALEAVNNMLETQLDSVNIVQLIIRRGSKSILEDLMFWFMDRFLLQRRIDKLVKVVNSLPSENFVGDT